MVISHMASFVNKWPHQKWGEGGVSPKGDIGGGLNKSMKENLNILHFKILSDSWNDLSSLENYSVVVEWIHPPMDMFFNLPLLFLFYSYTGGGMIWWWHVVSLGPPKKGDMPLGPCWNFSTVQSLSAAWRGRMAAGDLGESPGAEMWKLVCPV